MTCGKHVQHEAE